MQNNPDTNNNVAITQVGQPNTNKKPKGLIASTIICAVLAVAGAATSIALGIELIQNNRKIDELSEKIAALAREPETDMPENSNDIVAKTDAEIEEKAKTLANDIKDLLNGTFGVNVFNNTSDIMNTIRIPNSNVYTGSNKAYGVTSPTGYSAEDSFVQRVMSEAHDVVVRFLSGRGFNFLREQLSGDLYANQDGIYCDVDNGGFPYEVVCAHESWYDSENRELLLSLAKASGESYVSLNAPLDKSVQNSPVTPYQTLVVSGGTHAMLFYRVSPESDWVYFRGTQSVLDCNEYTGDVAKAFTGTTCWDEATQQNSTVKP